MSETCGAFIAGNPNRPCELPPHPEHEPHRDKLVKYERNEFYDNLTNDPVPEQNQIYQEITR